jgi:hypothetical protein
MLGVFLFKINYIMFIFIGIEQINENNYYRITV